MFVVKQIRYTNYKTSDKRSGFTLIELLIAVTFFSFILLFISAGFVALNRQFVKGRTTRDVQSDARFVVEDVTRSLRASTFGEVKSSSAIQADSFVCLGEAQYTWTTLSASQNASTIKRYTDGEEIRLAKSVYSGGPANCRDDNIVSGDSTELIGPNSVVQYLDIEDNFGEIAGLYKIILVLSTPQDEIIGADPEFANCEVLFNTGTVSPEYCSVVKFETIVNIRN